MRSVFAAFLISTALASAQPPQGGPAQSLLRAGKLDDALAASRKELDASPDSPAALRTAGTVLDLMGQGRDARTYFAKAIEAAPTPAAKAQAQRDMAMSYAFSGDCANTVKYEQMVFDYQVSAKDFYQQGEIADEAARVCIDAGDLDTAWQWYKKGHDAGLQQPDITPDRRDLWEFRWEHAQARLAARRGNRAEAEKHVAAAKALLDKDATMAQQQAPFFPYLTGYVAFYAGQYRKALDDLLKANQNDPFIQYLTGQAYDKLGDKQKALECYRKAASTTAHNPPAAFARRVAGPLAAA